MKGKYKGIEKRRYARLKSIFPVEFHFIPKEDRAPRLSGIQRGFTRNLSEGGICLEIDNLREDLVKALTSKKAYLSLTINIPLSFSSVKATAEYAWIKKIKETHPNKYLIGISYRTINKQGQIKIIKYARTFHWIPRIATLLIVVLAIVASIALSQGIRLQRENRILVAKLVSVLEKKTEIENSLTNIDITRRTLKEKLAEATKKIMFLQEEAARAKKEGELRQEMMGRLALLENELNNVSQVKEQLEKQLATVVAERSSLKENLSRAEEIKALLEEETIKIMYGWLQAHQDDRTGLVRSFAGNDNSLMDAAFTYDQALASMSFILFENYKSAEKIFDFYYKSAAKLSGGFANAYDAVTGNVQEYKVHTGPNIWMAIAILQYASKTGNHKYTDLAYDIGNWLILLQQEDPEGGIKGGPEYSWFSTEHNIDAYALFKILFKITGKQKYQLAADKTMVWLKNIAYNENERRFNRGKGDRTIATDTISLAIAAIGPARLRQEGIDPGRLIKFAEDNCRVTVDYLRPDGKRVKITGFDFTNPSYVGRAGVVSSEWTAQMVVAFKVLAKFYQKLGNEEKSKIYSQKAKFYWEELEKLAVVKPGKPGRKGGGFLYATKGIPYASKSWVDTGHGWMTAKGKDTLSIAGTAYGIFAQRGYNPLR